MASPSLSPIPELPPWPGWRQLRVFALGALWAATCGAAPAGLLILDWLRRWSDPLDWTMVTHMAVSGAAVGIFGYWRKYKALLTEPPK